VPAPAAAAPPAALANGVSPGRASVTRHLVPVVVATEPPALRRRSPAAARAARRARCATCSPPIIARLPAPACAARRGWRAPPGSAARWAAASATLRPVPGGVALAPTVTRRRWTCAERAEGRASAAV
jgi:hypothetical protein